MESETNTILHFENIDKRQVNLKSPNMEREGMIQCLDFLLANGLKIAELITDSSTSVAKTLGIPFVTLIIVVCVYHILLETNYPGIYHSRDVWHKSKKLKKALAEV